MNELELTHLYRGKVRDLYEVDPWHLLMVASDRLSAFDVVMDEPIPEKGRVLTALSHFWQRDVAWDVPSGLVTCDPDIIEELVPGFRQATSWHGRTSLVRRAEMMPLECIVRGRLAGQAYEEYQKTGTVHHMAAPSGMKLTDAFPEPMFTPSTKAETGHDENIDMARAEAIVGKEQLDRAKEICLHLFKIASETLEHAGLILADTKFELGIVDGELAVCDEVITPDSSRIWPADQVISGQNPPSFDKQPFRDWLATLDWDKNPPPPPVPDAIIDETSKRYIAAYERVTEQKLSDWYGQ